MYSSPPALQFTLPAIFMYERGRESEFFQKNYGSNSPATSQLASHSAPSQLSSAIIFIKHTKCTQSLLASDITYLFIMQNQQSLVLECSICAEKYGPNFDRQPRSLRCGHTFCTKCLMKIMTPRGVKCPMCSTMHPLSSPDVLLLPINHAVQEIVKNISTNDQKSITEQPELPPCGVCHNSPASIVCIDCQPGHQFKFCNQCDLDEHTRPFIPVQRHRRFPIDKAPLLNFTPCSRHSHVPASLYSESLNEFACSECQKDEDWFTRGLHFEGVMEVAKRMRVKIQKLTKYISAVFKEITESKQNLETIMNDLEPASMTVKVNITKTFSKLIEVLQERQKTLLANVEVEVSMCVLVCSMYPSF